MPQFDVPMLHNEIKGEKFMIENEILEQISNQIFEEHQAVLQTGFRDLDMMLSNIEKSGLIVIGSRPAMGKSSFALCIMQNILKQNKKCLLFSLDMSTQETIKRMLVQLSEIDSYTVTSNEKLKERQYYKNKIKNCIDTIRNYDLTIEDKNVSINDIEEQIKLMKPEFVFINYLQLINVSEKKPRSESWEIIVNKLKNIAKENECIIFMTSQLSRALESRIDKRPLLSDLRESGAIENIADVVMFIYRDEYYNTAQDEDYAYHKGRAEIIIAKNKNGPVGTVNLLFRSSIMKFMEPICDDTF